MTETTATQTAPIYTWPERDKYGRSCLIYKVGGRSVAIVVTLPRAAREQNPERAYLLNDWTQETYIDGQLNTAKVSYYAKRADAKRAAEAIAHAAGGRA